VQARLGFRFQNRTRWRAHSESTRAFKILYPRRKDVDIRDRAFSFPTFDSNRFRQLDTERVEKIIKKCREKCVKARKDDTDDRHERASEKERVALCSTRRRERTLNAKSIMSCGSGDGIVPGDAKSFDSKSEDLVLCFSLALCSLF
jgi:hypothetical protein